ncbi:MAG TPA: alpha/beta fold hydrolase [Jatrophihabitans sp.]|nr:alpha/beta fold hydrolase [Jatrophihabitans sp.]
MRLRTADDIVLSADYYTEVSDGPAYLVGHGFTGSSRTPPVVRIAERLRESGGSVLVLNFRGHGASEGMSTIGVDEIVDVEAGVGWLRARRPGVPVVTVGFSMGASIVIRYAGLGGNPAAVVAVSGPGRWYERGTEPMRRLHLGVETRLGRLVLHRAFRTRIGGGWDVLPASPVEVAPAVSAPLLVVHGDADPYFGLEHPRMLAAAAPNSELWIEAGLGHAENAMTPQLLERIAGWARRTVGTPATGTSATMNR